MIHFIISILIGGVAGWLASLIMKNANSTLVNIILGIVGGFVGLVNVVGADIEVCTFGQWQVVLHFGFKLANTV